MFGSNNKTIMIIKTDRIAYHVFIIVDDMKSDFIVGSTGNFIDRLSEIKPGYSLVYCEGFINAAEAMLREQEIGRLSLKRKKDLISLANPQWISLTGTNSSH